MLKNHRNSYNKNATIKVARNIFLNIFLSNTKSFNNLNFIIYFFILFYYLNPCTNMNMISNGKMNLK